ncbi:fibronectin type III domain-containing protein [Streptomyces sp. NPDC005708]|uniref:fibronectin type III domain-containing protein n=1 Tax=unclassified Streptomyces TaxID=2593676 RepID=UPI0033FD828A
MARIRLTFESLTLFQDEEAGDTHMAVYVTVKDTAGNQLAAFRWNNQSQKVDEVRSYSLQVDTTNSPVVDFELDSVATITVNGYTDDANPWPDAGGHENFLGTADALIDPRDPSTLGRLLLGPTTTDQGNTGYDMTVQARVVEPSQRAQIRLTFKDLLLLEDEEAGDTHVAVYIRAFAPAQGGVEAIDEELLRWNNGGAKVDEVHSYPMSTGAVTPVVDLTVGGPTQIAVLGYAADDNDWPDNATHENVLGGAVAVIDPADPLTLGNRQLGPTETDNGNAGFLITMTSEVLPFDATPDLEITGLEVTQAIQHFHSTLGADNSLPLVAGKATLVRAYLDSGIDPSEGGGTVDGVTGTLTVNGGAFSTGPTDPFTARPIAQVDRSNIAHTLNFLIPADKATGTVTLMAQATVAGTVSNPMEITVEFHPSPVIDILEVRVQVGSIAPPSDADYIRTGNTLPLRYYPIADDPATSIRYWILPGQEVITCNRDLTSHDGHHEFLEDLEDIQEEAPDSHFMYAMVANTVDLDGIEGISHPPDHVAFGLTGVAVFAHELAHLWGLLHAPCGTADSVDDHFVPTDGTLGDVGVDPHLMFPWPASTFDLMGECGPPEFRWISGYHWTKLWLQLNHPIFPLAADTADEAASPPSAMPTHSIAASRPFPGPYVRIRGRLSRSGSVRFSPAVRTFTAPPPQQLKATDAAAAPAYTVSLEDHAGHVLATVPTDPVFWSAEFDSALFSARLPYQARTHRIVLRRDGTELGALVVPPNPPHFVLTHGDALHEIDTEGVLHLRWRPVGDGPGTSPATYYVRFTNAAGTIAQWVGVNLTDTSFDLDLRGLPGDDRCLVQVIATNGFHTSYVQTPQFALTKRPPRILLGTTDGPLLYAQGTSPQHGALTGTAITWLVDGAPTTTGGGSLDVRTLTRGTHTIAVHVTDPDGLNTSQSLGRYDGASGLRLPPSPVL